MNKATSIWRLMLKFLITKQHTTILSALVSLIPLIASRVFLGANATDSTVKNPASSSFFMSELLMPLPCWNKYYSLIVHTFPTAIYMWEKNCYEQRFNCYQLTAQPRICIVIQVCGSTLWPPTLQEAWDQMFHPQGLTLVLLVWLAALPCSSCLSL